MKSKKYVWLTDAGHKSADLTGTSFNRRLAIAISILRGDLARLIYASLEGKIRTLFSDSIAAIEQDDNRVSMTLSMLTPENFDLVISARRPPSARPRTHLRRRSSI